MDKHLFQRERNSFIEKGEIYFWTATINGWNHLLKDDEYKDIVIDSLQYLSEADKISVFAFIIMPNHLHFIWRINELNGKESPQGSFLKYTAHLFKKKLLIEDREELERYRVNSSRKHFEFWQRDPLAIPIFTRKVALQKLNYLHRNPLAGHWQLVKHPCDYKYSSARYYERNEKEFTFLEDLWEVI